MCHEQKEVRNGVVSEGQDLGSSEEDESRIDNAIVNVNRGVTEVQNGLQIPKPQPQGPVIRWERFLPIRSLKVLLVENDESTRNLVSALLRNCSYEVTAVANGVQAWKILEDLTNHVDLVLTEVVMPVLSGLGLLSKIMSHKSVKNIPVIMMSSHDSMGLVFKCLSKGAVDFLVKPIRKNELKNLWQHVWRRCHSSSGSGSGSESGTQSKRSTKSKCNDDFENDTGSSDEHDNGSDGLMICDGSDNGSGTQSSWTKRAAVESFQPTSSSNQLPDAPDSICAQVIHANPETHGNQHVCISGPREGQEEDEQNDDAPMGKDFEIGIKRNPDLQAENQCDNLSTHQRSRKQNRLLEADCKQLLESGQMDQEKENMTCKDLSPNIITGIGNMNHQAGTSDLGTPTGPSAISYVKDKACFSSGEVPSLELTLKRPQGDGASRNATSDDQNVLRHSESSAFSKYNTASANQTPTGNVGSNSPHDNSSVAMKTETTQNFPSHSNVILLNHQSNGSSNNNDIISTAKYVTPKPEALKEKFESLSAFKPFHSSAFQPAQNGHISSAQEALPEKANHMGVNAVDAQVSGSNQLFTIQHGYYHHSMQRQSLTESSLKSMAITSMQCGSSNVFDGPTECNVVNYSVNGSASGSNHGSNGPNGSSIAPNAEQTNVESHNGAAGNSEAGAISGRTSASGLDEDRAAHREAALTKFRQKRKERCFEKKVRYQSRKKLAEQRPRVKGQFVRQTVSDSEGRKDCPGSNGDNSCDSSR
ncbi:hypothetical protein SLE2022_196930 [Rubroshorea leprosula]